MEIKVSCVLVAIVIDFWILSERKVVDIVSIVALKEDKQLKGRIWGVVKTSKANKVKLS